MDTLQVYLGFDRREPEATVVAKRSLQARSTLPLHITLLGEENLRHAGLYDRPFVTTDGQRYDTRDGKPFSTDFSFTRFLVPVLCNYQGWALFSDGDFLYRGDIAEVMDLADDKFAIMCVKHDHRPEETTKMDGQKQELYRRKNWSSFVLWNCSHPANRSVTPQAVNFMPGSKLHQFFWLDDSLIGTIPDSWNWLAGYSPESWEPKAVHYTSGIPTMKGYENAPYADEWKEYLNGDHDLRSVENGG